MEPTDKLIGGASLQNVSPLPFPLPSEPTPPQKKAPPNTFPQLPPPCIYICTYTYVRACLCMYINIQRIYIYMYSLHVFGKRKRNTRHLSLSFVPLSHSYTYDLVRSPVPRPLPSHLRVTCPLYPALTSILSARGGRGEAPLPFPRYVS